MFCSAALSITFDTEGGQFIEKSPKSVWEGG